MDFNYLSTISQPRYNINKKNQKFESRLNEKKTPSSQVTSNAVQAYLARKQEEERKKYEEAKRRKEELLSLRAQNSKNNKKAKIMASRTKDNDFSKIKLSEEEVEAKIKREQELNKKHLTNTVERMKARIQLEERDNQLPRTRKRKTNDYQTQSLKNNSNVEIEYKFNGNSVPVPVVVNKNKDIEKRKQISKSKTVPVMDYRNLLEIAAKKQFEPDLNMEYEDFNEESDEYEEDQMEMSQTKNHPNYNTQEQIHKQDAQNMKLSSKISDKHKLKQNKENSYHNNSLKNEILQNSNTHRTQLNKSHQKCIVNNFIHTKVCKSSDDRDSFQKTSHSNNNNNNNNSNLINNNKHKVPPKLNKYEEYIRIPVDKLHSEEEYVPQFQKPTLIPKKSIQIQKERESNNFLSNETTIKNNNKNKLLNKRNKFEQSSFHNIAVKRNHNEKIIRPPLLLNNNLDKNKKPLHPKRPKDLLKFKNESFKIPKKRKEIATTHDDGDDDTPCYYTNGNEEQYSEKSKNQIKMNNHVIKKTSERKQDSNSNKKREFEERSLINNKMSNHIPNSVKTTISSDRHNSRSETKSQIKLHNSKIRKNVHKIYEQEEPKQYFTIAGEEKSKYDPISKSFMKNKYSKDFNSASNEEYQYFTEDFKINESACQKKNNIKNIKQNQKNIIPEKNQIKSITNTHKLNHNRSEARKYSYNEFNISDRSESPPAKLYKSENIRNETKINQKIEKFNDQNIQNRKMSFKNKSNEYQRFKINDENFKEKTKMVNDKNYKEFTGKNFNSKIKNEDRFLNKTEKNNSNYINMEKSKYPEYTSIQKSTLNEGKSKSNFIQKENAFAKKALIEKKNIIPPSGMTHLTHLMQKEVSQKNVQLKSSEKQRLENRQKQTNGKLPMITKNSENLSRIESKDKIPKKFKNSDFNINKYSEKNVISSKTKSEKHFQSSNDITNFKKQNAKIRPITSSDYVGIKRDRYGRPLATMFLKKNLDSDEEEEEEEEDEEDDDMADFIDDGPLEDDSEDYSRYIREIFGYDKRRYCYEDDLDDQAMESSYAEQMKEERRSARIGLLEDLEDIRKEEEEKQKKALKKK